MGEGIRRKKFAKGLTGTPKKRGIVKDADFPQGAAPEKVCSSVTQVLRTGKLLKSKEIRGGMKNGARPGGGAAKEKAVPSALAAREKQNRI